MKTIAIFCTLFFLIGCQTPTTKMIENDQSIEGRVFAKIEYGKPAEMKRAVIVDVRSRFDHEMSRPPRSFHAFWKDWDLAGYSGENLEEKRKELQRLLSLHGIDPLVQVVILGEGLKGRGEEFLVASTLISLGVQRISFMSASEVRDALVARGLPKIENLPYWEKPLSYNFTCEDSTTEPDQWAKKADVVVEGEPSQYFRKSLQLKRSRFAKGMDLKIYDSKGFWAYGVALHLREQGRRPCVLR